jgi:type IV secretion system protein VirD4
MFSLPRGNGLKADAPLATADWEAPHAVERMAYRGKGSLFVGAIPAFETWPALTKLYDDGNNYLDAIEGLDRPAKEWFSPLERSDKVARLEELWRAAQLADCVPLGIADDRHFVTVAGSRAGKGRSAIIPNLCIYEGSVVCLDPKGENATRTAERRGTGADDCGGMGQEVFVLDPFGVAKVSDALRAGLNPLALLDPNDEEKADTIVNDAEMLAEGLIVPADSRDSHWDDSARNFVKGLILHLVTTMKNPTLLTLRRFLTRGDVSGWTAATAALEGDEDEQRRFLRKCPSAFEFLLKEMQSNEQVSGVVAATADTLLECADSERGSILSVARRNTAFLDTTKKTFVETMEAKGRTFSPDVFKKASQGASLFLCLPAERMGTHGRWLRMIIGLLLEHAYRDLSPPACGAPFLFLLDEFFSLGHMQVIEKAAGYAAGFGIKLWAILQDIQQLKAIYPNSWQTFLANAGAVQVFGVSDAETTEYVSKALGQIELIKNPVTYSDNANTNDTAPPSPHALASGVIVNSEGRSKVDPLRLSLLTLRSSSSHTTRAITASSAQHFQPSPLLQPDEIAAEFSRESGAALLLIKGRKPVWCLRVDYDSSPWFWGLFVPTDAEKKRGGMAVPFGQRTPAALTAVEKEYKRFGASL